MNIVVVDMQPISPAVGGGRLRLLGLYHNLGEGNSATYVGSYDWEGEPARDQVLTERLREICVPLSKAHHEAAQKLTASVQGGTVIDSAFSIQAALSPEWIKTAAEHISRAETVIFSHPWAYGPLREYLRPDHFVVYDSHNVESVLKASLMGMEGAAEPVVREVVQNEYELCVRADLVVACSQEDVDCYARMYGLSYRKMRIVPNGTFTEGGGKEDEGLREAVRKSLDLPSNARIAVFVGSNYGPNVQAARFIAESLVKEVPDVTFVIIGGAGDSARSLALPSNLRITGMVDDVRRDELLRAADLAVNPMTAGSGTNIKMFDFLAAGLPVVTTEIGARGICDSTSGPPFILVRSLKEFSSAVDSALRLGDSELQGEGPQQYVRRLFSWERIAPEMGRLLSDERSNVGKGRPKAVMLSTWNVRCGIGEHSIYFAEEMRRQGWDTLVLGNATQGHHRSGFKADLHFPVARLWRWDNHTWQSGIDLEALSRIANDDKPELAIIQHHTAFMPVEAFGNAIRILKDAGARVIVELHDARHVPRTVLEELATAVDLLVLHDAQELDGIQAERYPSLTVLPLPTPFYGASGTEAVEREAGPVISGFGFLRPYKGLLDVVKTIGELRKRFPGVRYRGFHALYDAESVAHLEECMSEAERLGVRDCIAIDSSFRPLEEIIAKIAATDVVLLPYKASNEGASAAVNSVLTAGRATVVSDAKIFKPVSHVVRVVPGESPRAYADAIAELLTNPVEREQLEHAAHDWTRDHSYSVIVERMISKLSLKEASP